MFPDKLNFLMNLTHSSNSALGESVSLDASYISRLRNGSRKLPKDPAFIPAMVDYFASNINTEEQKRILATVPAFPYSYENDNDNLNQLLHHWLLQNTADTEEPVEAFLRRFSISRHQAAAAMSVTERNGQPIILDIYQKRETSLLDNLKHYTVIDFISLPSLDTVLQGSLPLPLRELFGLPYLDYTTEEFRLHLENIIHLLRTQPHYHVVMHQQSSTPYLLCVKEDFGVMLSKITNPNAVFLIEETGMTTAFWNYLYRQAKKSIKTNRPQIIRLLEQYLEDLT